jgi:hypothetical protein
MSPARTQQLRVHHMRLGAVRVIGDHPPRVLLHLARLIQSLFTVDVRQLPQRHELSVNVRQQIHCADVETRGVLERALLRRRAIGVVPGQVRVQPRREERGLAVIAVARQERFHRRDRIGWFVVQACCDAV